MLKVLATGSKGNCYIVQAGGEILLLECGIVWKEILKGLKFDLSNVVGCLVTHEHKDHCKAVNEVMKSGIDVYMSDGTKEEIGIDSYRIHEVKSQKSFKLRGFTILPFDTQHDVKEPLGFLIHHKELGKVLFATDTFYLKYRFDNIDHILIECNYSESILEDLPPYRARLLKSHMSLETLKETLSTWDLEGTKDITLIHMSENHGEPEYFREEIEKVTGVKTLVAVPGLEID